MFEIVDWKLVSECLLVSFTGFLWWDTRRLANEAKASSDKSLTEAKRLATAAEKSASAAEAAESTAKSIHESEKLLSQRQLIVPLWTYITSMEEIRPNEIIEPDVRKTINALELIALCCEGGMIDEDVIKATFTDIYIRQYETIGSLPHMKGLNKDGKAILRENRASTRFYDKLKAADKEIGKLTNKL